MAEGSITREMERDALIKSLMRKIHDHIDTNDHADDFFLEVAEVMSSRLRKEPLKSSHPLFNFYNRLVSEIAAFACSDEELDMLTATLLEEIVHAGTLVFHTELSRREYGAPATTEVPG